MPSLTDAARLRRREPQPGAHAPDLLAESRAAMLRGTGAVAAMTAWTCPQPWTRERAVRGPGGPDQYVFGGHVPDSAPVPAGGPRRYCPEHPGLSWCGTEPCWVCEPEVSQ